MNVNNLKEGDVFTIKRWLTSNNDQSWVGAKLRVVAVGSVHIGFEEELSKYGHSGYGSLFLIKKDRVDIENYEKCCCKCRCS